MVNTGKQMLRTAIGSGRTVITHAAVTGHNAMVTMPYCPLPTQALLDSLSSAVDCVSNRAALLRLFILCHFLFYPSFKLLCL
jgi:delta 1-pyrroline-5-carboxylate dehydrogenase